MHLFFSNDAKAIILKLTWAMPNCVCVNSYTFIMNKSPFLLIAIATVPPLIINRTYCTYFFPANAEVTISKIIIHIKLQYSILFSFPLCVKFHVLHVIMCYRCAASEKDSYTMNIVIAIEIAIVVYYQSSVEVSG